MRTAHPRTTTTPAGPARAGHRPCRACRPPGPAAVAALPLALAPLVLPLALALALALALTAGCAENLETPDGPFFRTGYALVQAGSVASGANAMARMPDGRLVVVGYTEDAGSISGRDVLLARFLADGSLDRAFGSDGIAVFDLGSGTTPPEAAHDTATALALLPDGGLVVVGYSDRPTGERLAFVTRHRPDGSLDTRFDGGGTFAQPGVMLLDLSDHASGGTLAGEPSEWHTVLLHQQEGVKVVLAAGWATADSDASGTATREVALAKLTLTGRLADGALAEAPALDEFGSGGVATVHVRTDSGSGDESDDEAFALALQPTAAGQPRLIVVGRSVLAGESDSLVLRLDLNGTVEETWVHDFGGEDELRAVLVPPAPATQTPPVVVGGSIIPTGSTLRDVLLARLQPDATALDPDFGTAGQQMIDAAGDEDVGRALARDSSGRLLLAGTRTLNGVRDMVAFRFGPDGHAPELFWRRFTGGDDDAEAVATDAFGTIYLAGRAGHNGLDALGVARIIPLN